MSIKIFCLSLLQSDWQLTEVFLVPVGFCWNESYGAPLAEEIALGRRDPRIPEQNELIEIINCIIGRNKKYLKFAIQRLKALLSGWTIRYASFKIYYNLYFYQFIILCFY